MSLEVVIRERIKKAPFKSVEKEVFKVLLGSLQNATLPLTAEKEFALVGKLIKGNEETISFSKDPERIKTLEEENVHLKTLLPGEAMSKSDIVSFIIESKINFADGTEGQAIGTVYKTLKISKKFFNGDDVKDAVRILRGNDV